MLVNSKSTVNDKYRRVAVNGKVISFDDIVFGYERIFQVRAPLYLFFPTQDTQLIYEYPPYRKDRRAIFRRVMVRGLNATDSK